MILESVVGLASTALVGMSSWVVNLSSRVAVLEKGQTDQLALIDAKLDKVVNMVESLEKRQERVERSMNGFLYRDS